MFYLTSPPPETMGCESSVEADSKANTKPATQQQQPAQAQPKPAAATNAWSHFGLGHTNNVVKGGDKIAVIIDGKARHVPNMTVHNNLFPADIQYGDLAAALAGGVEEGAPLSADAYLVKGENNHVYLVDGGNKRWVTGPELFVQLGFAWDKIQTKSQAEVDAIPDGPHIGLSPKTPFFRNPKTTEIFVLFNGYLRHVPNPEAWNRVFNVELKDAQYLDVAEGNLVFPKGAKLGDNFAIVKGSTDHVWVVDGDHKYHIASMDVFNRLHLAQSKIQQGQDALIGGLTEGHKIL